MTDLPLLTIVVALPILGALVALILPRAAVWWWALLVALLDLAATLAIFAQFQAGQAGYQIVENYRWLPEARHQLDARRGWPEPLPPHPQCAAGRACHRRLAAGRA